MPSRAEVQTRVRERAVAGRELNPCSCSRTGSAKGARGSASCANEVVDLHHDAFPVDVEGQLVGGIGQGQQSFVGGGDPVEDEGAVGLVDDLVAIPVDE